MFGESAKQTSRNVPAAPVSPGDALCKPVLPGLSDLGLEVYEVPHFPLAVLRAGDGYCLAFEDDNEVGRRGRGSRYVRDVTIGSAFRTRYPDALSYAGARHGSL